MNSLFAAATTMLASLPPIDGGTTLSEALALSRAAFPHRELTVVVDEGALDDSDLEAATADARDQGETSFHVIDGAWNEVRPYDRGVLLALHVRRSSLSSQHFENLEGGDSSVVLRIIDEWNDTVVEKGLLNIFGPSVLHLIQDVDGVSAMLDHSPDLLDWTQRCNVSDLDACVDAPKRVLRMAYDAWPPLLIAPGESEATLSGVMHDVLLIIAGRLGLGLDLRETVDRGVWGIEQADGNWSGMMGMVQRGEVDGVAPGMGVTEERMELVDFTVTVLRMSVGVFAKRSTGSQSQVSRDNYVKEFDGQTWSLVLATSVLLVMGFFTALYPSQLPRQWQKAAEKASGIVLRALLYKGSNVDLDPLSVKILLMVTLLFTTVLFVCYRGALNSFLAITSPTTRIETLDDVLDQTRGLTFWEGTYFEQVFQDSDSQSTAGKLYRQYNQDSRAKLTSYEQGLLNVKLDDYVLIGEKEMILLEPMYSSCEVDLVPYHFYTQVSVAFALSRGSPYLDSFNREILELKNKGVVDRLMKKYFYHGKSECLFTEASSLGFGNVFTPFFFLGSGIFAGAALSVIEYLARILRRSVEPDKCPNVSGLTNSSARRGEQRHAVCTILRSEDIFEQKLEAIMDLINRR